MIKSNERLIVEALEEIFGRTVKAIISDGVIVQWGEIDPQPSKEEIEDKINQITSEYPMTLLRKERDRRIALSDWRLTNDYPHKDQEQWIIYRQDLRDIPSKIEDGILPIAKLDDYGQLDWNHWPSEPN